MNGTEHLLDEGAKKLASKTTEENFQEMQELVGKHVIKHAVFLNVINLISVTTLGCLSYLAYQYSILPQLEPLEFVATFVSVSLFMRGIKLVS